jgi:hypothetical protein
MSFRILARDGSDGDFVEITIKARSLAGALAKLRSYGNANGFFYLSPLEIREV